MSLSKTISPDNIIYLEADVNYSIFHFENGKKRISSFTLKYYENKEETNHFLRIHRSYLLNPHYIISIYKRGHNSFIKMANGKEIKVSRRKRGLIADL
ncbi:LytTR family DNA-binding domain-containing protein [Emticicia sp. BO119]|uniref:LytR/AlgR family response regulator transcription factor n=1 Tax=Emticicia sp. BO119 TaxID=2757768 RepID=UPI0015F0734C|nr:LytTR family DNA-binding domain-containing protein [Emticicia sp. BO119]MBA4850279.1 LytTR family transcriptional regulator [Emticicia sp. BO119]